MSETFSSQNRSPAKAGSILKGGAAKCVCFRTEGHKTKGMELATTRSSFKERKGNALASGAEESRDKLR